jgi:hypothetical protein
MRLDKRGFCSYWVWGLCDMHNVENIFKAIKGKLGLDMDKMNTKRAMWQKGFVMKGSLGVQPKEHLMRLEQEEMGGSSMVGASPVTYAVSATTSISGNAAWTRTSRATTVITSDEETKRYEEFKRWVLT